ncbi:MAG: hypothetical protein ACK6CE_09470 [Planctomycetota bacterium]
MSSRQAPLLKAFLPSEQRLVRQLDSPARVQAWLNQLPYNKEVKPVGETLRSFRGVVEHGTAHCLEAALFAAVVLEQHGYPPLLLSFQSICLLDHVIFVYQAGGRWGSIARSRDPGLHGRKPVFDSARDLAKSYFDPYIDAEGCIKGFVVVNIAEELPRYNWRFSRRNVWKVEQLLNDYPHQRLKVDWQRRKEIRAKYLAFRKSFPDHKPLKYEGRDTWKPLPPEFTSPGYERDWV